MASPTTPSPVGSGPDDWPHPFDPAVLANPAEYNRRLRREAPVFRDPHTGIYLVSGHAEVVQALHDWELFSNRFAAALGGGGRRLPAEVLEVASKGYPPIDTMLTADPPEQRRYRRLVAKAFVPRRVKALEPRVESLSHELIDAFEHAGCVELRAEYAQLLPLTLIAEQLGVPREDLPRFRRWSDGFVAQLGQMADLQGQIEAAETIVEFQHYFAERLEERREKPQEDILSAVVHATVEDERPLDVAECLSILQQLLVAGNETTASTIVDGVHLLVTHPDELARVEQDASLVPNLVEEVLRLSSPTANMWRVVTRDTELGGVEIPKGSFAMVRFASANRDESVFPDADRFDVRRPNASEHLAFGHGIHLCLGAPLARLELDRAFRTLLERLCDWQIDADPASLRYRPNVLLHGLESLPLRFRRRS